jgi:rare lipoprotein A
MANGKKLEDYNVLTAAMWGVPFGTRVLVRNLTNNKSCVVVITDRGPAKRLVRKGRIIDLNYEAMYRLDGIPQGVIPCKVEEVK